MSFCKDEDNVDLIGDEEPTWLWFVAALSDGEEMVDDWRLGGDFCWSLERGDLLGTELSLVSIWDGRGIGSGVIGYKKMTHISISYRKTETSQGFPSIFSFRSP